MAFSSEAALKAALAAACVNAVSTVEKKVHNKFSEKLNQYYGEFVPAEYIRTSALHGSLNTTGTMSTGSGATAEIYFDTPSYQTGQIPIQSTARTGRMGYATWDGGQVLNTAMHGSHGGFAGGTAIWDESLAELGDIHALLIQALQAQGL